MYSRQEASQIRKEFWTRFGQYMKPIAGADGSTTNWLNYKTGIKGIYFRMDADKDKATVAIEIKHPDKEVQANYYGQLYSLKSILEDETHEAWDWQEQKTDEQGSVISSIGITLSGVNIFNQQDWPSIISFFKPRIIALDNFWNLVKESFS